MKDEQIINNSKTVDLMFLAIDQYIDDHIVRPVEKQVKNKGFILWGENNDYPAYLDDLYHNVSTLKSIIDGLTDYICGNKVYINDTSFTVTVNKKGHSINDLVKWIAKDLAKYNGFALNIIKNRLGGVAEIYYLDFKKVRASKDAEHYYYSDEWDKSAGRVNFIEYDSFLSDTDQASTIFYYKNDINSVYPFPLYGAAVVACEIEKLIGEYHINLVNNGFASNYIVNFNNGKPTDVQKAEIERNFYEKFTGIQNGGRPMLSFNNGKANETTITKVETDNFADKYNSLAERTRQEIFTAFRATPNLFGIPTETTGFSEQEYTEAFKLFNRTVVKPFQNVIKDNFKKIFHTNEDILVIEPFTIEEDEQ